MARLAVSAAAVAAAAFIAAKLRDAVRAEPVIREPAAPVPAVRAVQRARDAPEAGSGVKSEFFVDMHCGGCANSVRKALSGLQGVEIVEISVEKQTVVTRGDRSAQRRRRTSQTAFG